MNVKRKQIKKHEKKNIQTLHELKKRQKKNFVFVSFKNRSFQDFAIGCVRSTQKYQLVYTNLQQVTLEEENQPKI